ncbi:MAG: ROK family protein [Acidimicrobiaceae bacterium]|nr:ROK family protein [Acidimicrobiaceae bacterium]
MQLTHKLGLGRTTVLELVGHLAELGLISESHATGTIGVGRPSMVVTATSLMGAFAVNPESDALRVGMVTFDGQVIHSLRQPTADALSPEQAAIVAAELINEIRENLPRGFRIAGAGVAIPGQVSRSTGVVLSAPRLGWADCDFKSLLASKTGLSVWLDNNARLVTQAEHRLGTGRGLTDFVYLFAGAGGIGGGIVVDNQVLTGTSGFAGEVGHVRISDSPQPDFLGLPGTFEALIKRDDLLATLGYTNVTDTELDQIIQRADGAEFLGVADRQLQTLGVVLGNLANILDPQMIVLGGFLGSLYRRLPEVLDASVAGVVLPGIGRSLRIRPSTFGPEMVLCGAAELVFSEVVARPLAFRFVEES